MWAVVVTQLSERSLRRTAVLGSNTVTSANFYHELFKKTKITKKEAGKCPFICIFEHICCFVFSGESLVSKSSHEVETSGDEAEKGTGT